MAVARKTERPANKKLLHLRDAGWTQEEIARMYGRGRSTITKWMAEAEAEEERAYHSDMSTPQAIVASTGGRHGK